MRAMIVGSPPSRTATAELVVPRSMPTARAISFLLYDEWSGERCSPLCCCGPDFTSSSWPNVLGIGLSCQADALQTCAYPTQLTHGVDCSRGPSRDSGARWRRVHGRRDSW